METVCTRAVFQLPEYLCSTDSKEQNQGFLELFYRESDFGHLIGNQWNGEYANIVGINELSENRSKKISGFHSDMEIISWPLTKGGKTFIKRIVDCVINFFAIIKLIVICERFHE